MTKSTKSLKPTEVSRKWYLIDASGKPLGRVATIAARLLNGKHKPTYTPHVDGGDYVVIINADDVKITGRKRQTSKYYRHSGHPGALKERTLGEQMEKDSSEAIRQAVRGMIDANKLRDSKLKRLKVYTDDKHQHDAQQPSKIEELK